MKVSYERRSLVTDFTSGGAIVGQRFDGELQSITLGGLADPCPFRINGVWYKPVSDEDAKRFEQQWNEQPKHQPL